MQYLIVFLEGMITFISPCLLPMLPVYLSYFAGGGAEVGASRTLRNALGFVTGFTAVFTALGALAGSLGAFLYRYRARVDLIAGLVMIALGLSFLGVVPLRFFGGIRPRGSAGAKPGFAASALFGMIFAVGWTPCVGAFLGSALMMAATAGGRLQGTLMLLCFSAGLGIPFVLSALFIERFKSASGLIQKHYRVVHVLSGLLLVVVGVLMATGRIGFFYALFS